MAMILLSFGHGYSARALARLLPGDAEVIATTRSLDKAETLRAKGVTARIFPGDDLRDDLARATHILVSAGPGAGGDPVLAALREDIAAIAGQKTWIGYLSTTGVYGDHQGGWVSEETALAPSTDRGRARVAAETAWQDLAAETGAALHIFRLAGIYGPGRGPFAKVRRGTARRIIKQGQVFSRIHVEDIAQVLLASIQRPNPGAIYNVCDNLPAPPEDVIAYAARLLGRPVPPDLPIDQAEMSPMARSFYAESKRVANRRIREELGVTLRYPDYHTGLEALLAAETDD
ncbi:SDR family oxidoreductase [Rhodophyticola sp. CCM32]|nr:SDR family oxidoreductase [Rhodophyticola sp. CCM32]QBY01960.1 SDR family oxidoreductase [Rhodophyticola sp. CCM32]